MYTHGGGGELCEGAASISLPEALCGQTGGELFIVMYEITLEFVVSHFD